MHLPLTRRRPGPIRPLPAPPHAALGSLGDYEQSLKQRYADLTTAVALLEQHEARTRAMQAELARLLGLPATTSHGPSRPAVAPKPGHVTFVVSSLFLADCYRFLQRGPVEWLHYVTGVQLGPVQTLDRIVPFTLATQTPVYVAGDAASARDALCDLAASGHALHGVFHNHRMSGPAGVIPSTTDLKHQEGLERGGYRAISAIFSIDHYVRFFSCRLPFSIEIYGKGIENCGDDVFKLTAPALLHDPGAPFEPAGRSDGVG